MTNFTNSRSYKPKSTKCQPAQQLFLWVEEQRKTPKIGLFSQCIVNQRINIISQCPVGLNSSKTICEALYNVISKYVNDNFLTVYLLAFELKNSVTMSPKHVSFLSQTFTCLCFTKTLLSTNNIDLYFKRLLKSS